MSNFLLECLSEEIPSSAQKYAETAFIKVFESELSNYGIPYQNIKSFVAPRRIAIFITGLPDKISMKEILLKGPKVNSSKEILQNFLKRINKSSENLYIQKFKNEDFYFIKNTSCEKLTHELLTELTNKILKNWHWPKSMRWGSSNIKWVRPLRKIICMFDNTVLPVQLGEIKACNITEGHRFKTASKEIYLDEAASYEESLKKEFVIVDQNLRKQFIRDFVKESSHLKGLNVNLEEESIEELICEVAGLVEIPYGLIGKIDDSFADLPASVIEITMKKHQRYFPLYNYNGKIAPFFIIISNFVCPTPSIEEKIIQGNEKVLRARLADAKFLIKQDLATPIEYSIHKLSKIIFHKRLGSILDKTERIVELAKYIAFWVPHAHIDQVEEVAKLVKFDLATGLVREFPELQGIAGSYYASQFALKPYISQAITEHYYPLSANSPCTNNPIAIAIALSDKIDSLVGLMAAGEKVTSARDPYALRRSALGIIKTIIENNINLPLEVVLNKSASLYSSNLFKEKSLNELKSKSRDSLTGKNLLVDKVLIFCVERIKSLLKNHGIAEIIVDALPSRNNPLGIWIEANTLNKFIMSNASIELFSVYKRVSNILKRSLIRVENKSVAQKLITTPEEQVLLETLNSLEVRIKELSKSTDLQLVIDLLMQLIEPLNNFMDKVTVNVAAEEVKLNRLIILTNTYKMFNKVINIELLHNNINI